MSIEFAPDVERWRATVAKYVPAQYVDKVLWTISGESGGNPSAIGDGGVSIGLLQIQDSDQFASRPPKAQLLDPEFNIQYAAEQLGISNGNFSAWGDGTNGTANQFGALGANPFPDAGSILAGIPGAGAVGGAVADAGSFIKDSAGNIISNIPGVGSVLDAAQSSASFFFNAAKAFVWLLDPHHWFRLFFLGVGAAMFGVGAFIFVRGDSAIGDVTSAAKLAAESGA